MKRLAVLVIVVALLAALPAAASALGTPQAPPAAVAGGETRVVPLGLAYWHGRVVEGYAFIHGRASAAKPPKPTKTDPLYTFLARGARLRTTEPFVVNTHNHDGVSPGVITAAMDAAAAAWEAQVTFNLFGQGTTTSEELAADWTQPDGVNEVYFSENDPQLDSGTVAVTVVWGIFSGSPSTREIFEWDMVFNDGLPEPWGDGLANGWDVQEIATHEIGHSAGLGDLYSTSAIAQTMYGYASPGETDKRTLDSGDIAGIKALYQ